LLLLACPVRGDSAALPGKPLQSFEDDLDLDSLRLAIDRSLEFLSRVPPDRPVGEWPRRITAREVRDSLLSFIRLLEFWDRPEALARELQARFDLFESPAGGGGERVLFTGYYQPVVAGSLMESRDYRYPVYRKPPDLVEAETVTLRPQHQVKKVVGRFIEDRLVPYPSRYEIDGLGQLRGKGYEIAWLKDSVELFFLHIQGSGLLRLEDGRMLHLNYAASNGRAYQSIGKILADGGKIALEELSMQRLRQYLTDHPRELPVLLAQNERYVFFRFGKRGPLGSLDVPLTPGRSIATDSRLFPLGALAVITARRPLLDSQGNLAGWRPFMRFVLNQDAGAAIQGPGRVDLYFGAGGEPGMAAGVMKSGGSLRFLLQKRPAAGGSSGRQKTNLSPSLRTLNR